MTGHLVVVEGFKLKANPGTIGGVGNLLIPKIKCQGKQICNSISFTVTDNTFSGSGNLTANSTKAKGGGLAMILDNATVTVTLSDGHGGTEPSVITVDDPGQGKVRAV